MLQITTNAAPVGLNGHGHLAIETRGLNIYYGNFKAIQDVNLQIKAGRITAIIGPSGCGKSTLLRAFNRMNDSVPGTGLRARYGCTG